jgi:hypothetical protein
MGEGARVPLRIIHDIYLLSSDSADFRNGKTNASRMTRLSSFVSRLLNSDGPCAGLQHLQAENVPRKIYRVLTLSLQASIIARAAGRHAVALPTGAINSRRPTGERIGRRDNHH